MPQRFRFSIAATGVLVSAVLGNPVFSQAPARPWQTLNFPTRAQVAAAWKQPPPEYGPEPYYGLNGHFTLDSVWRDLDGMKAMGFTAVTVQYGYGSSMQYLSREYMAFFRQFVAEVKQRGMRVWIVDDAGYPSGFAGGKFTTEHPELRMQALTAARPQPVAAGAAYDTDVPADTVAVTAINRVNGDAVALPLSNGHATWTAPAGDWAVTVVEHVFRTSPTRSDTNPNRVKDGSQSLEDYLNPAATAQYLAFTHEQYKRAVGDEFGKTVLGFRGDEPDYSIAGLPWTPKFFDSFQAKKGYDVRPFLAALLQPKTATLTPRQLRAKADYYDVFADLFRDGFFKPQADWCAANGMEYQVHLNHEEMQLELVRSEGDFFRDMRFVQVPGIDSIWHQIWTDTVSDFPRLASSAAHVYGHPRSFTESFAAYRPAPDITAARYILNEQFVRGINLIETMYLPASVDDKGGPSALMRDPGFPDLMHSSSRLGFLMSQGHPAAQVALLLPSASLWMGSVRTDDTFVSAERLLSEHQVDFDIVDEDAVGSLLHLEGGAFTSGSGNRYRTLLVPNATALTRAAMDRLKQFGRSGGKVVFLGAPPQFVAGRNYLEAAAVTDTGIPGATVVPGELPRVPTPPAQPPAAAPEAMAVPQGYWEAVAAQLPPQVVTLARPSTALRVSPRLLGDASVILLFNESAQPIQQQVTLARAGAQRAEVWDPQTGSSRPTESRAVKTGVQLDLAMAPYESRILVIY